MQVLAPQRVAPAEGRRWLPWPSTTWGRDAVGAAALLVLALVVDLADGTTDPAALAVTVMGCALLAGRRVAPVPVLAAELVVVGVAFAVAGIGDVLPTFAVALYTAVERAPSPVGAALTGVLGTAGLGLVVLGATAGEADVLTRELGTLTIGVLAVGLGLTVGGFRRSVAVAQLHAERDHAAAVRQRVAEERVRIARDLHDVVGHEVAVITVQAGLASHLMESQPARAAEALDRVQEAGAHVLEELPALLRVLRQSDDSPDTAPSAGLDQLEVLVAHARGAGIVVTVERGDDLPDLGATADATAYRVVQEALTNAAKHGDGSAQVRLGSTGGTVVLEVANGIGSGATQGSGLGLVGMRERVEAADGTLETGARDGRFVVRAVLPGRAGSRDRGTRPADEHP
ncbi:sensor histidine kinase [Isoptericola aurantiacus]|uniref:sensor histidine kinase n=1 Tax=Isoptericola aurantiacus TaxID=3377839 RepID=UPI00383A7F7D